MAVVLNKRDLTDADVLRVLALSALRLSEADRSRLAPGEYKIDDAIFVHIGGTIRIGADGTQEVVAKVDTWGLLSLALDKLNTVTLERLLEEYFDGDVAAAGAELKKRTTRAIRKLKRATRTSVQGKITKDLEINWQ